MVAAFFVTATEVGQALIAVLVAVIGYVLHRKSSHIEVMVDGRMTSALAEITELRTEVAALNQERRDGLQRGDT
jgi:hypothetical protein